MAVLHPAAPLVATVNGRAWNEMSWAKTLERAEDEHGFCVESNTPIPYLPGENIDARVLLLRKVAL